MILIFGVLASMVWASSTDQLQLDLNEDLDEPTVQIPLGQADLLDEGVALRRVGAFSDAEAMCCFYN